MRFSYKDPDGRWKVVLLPEGASEEEVERGIPIGPPPLAELGLPLETEVRLNNELYHRDILTPGDAMRRRSEIVQAIQAAFKVDANSVVTLFVGRDYVNASTPAESIPNTAIPHRRPRKPA